MQLQLQRAVENSDCIIGHLYVDGAAECFTLELPSQFEGEQNVPDKTCIPEGTYLVRRLYSDHFNRMMPHVVNVPGRQAIEIHWGNTAKDVLGCILVGELRISDFEIGESRAAFAAFDNTLEAAWSAGETIMLEVKDIQFATRLPDGQAQEKT